jgi:two-component system alkaline phosphatase synthesis response regulator PhoP
MIKLLIIDDEEDIRQILSYNLRKEGFEVFEAKTGEEGIRSTMEHRPDLILLDVMMPDMDGVEVCESLRREKGFENVLICFLTARNEDYSQIAGLDAGADDYVAKPVKPKVLISRIKALLRRKGVIIDSVGDGNKGLVINRDKYLVELDGNDIHLPRKEFELLALLASKAGSVFEREIILSEVWGSDIVVGERTIDVHIRKLREKIGAHYIQTVKGIGYRFSEES